MHDYFMEIWVIVMSGCVLFPALSASFFLVGFKLGLKSRPSPQKQKPKEKPGYVDYTPKANGEYKAYIPGKQLDLDEAIE